MLIQFNGQWLTNDGSGTYSERAITSAQEVRPTAEEVIQIAQFLRGKSSMPYDRGNQITNISFKVTRNFALINPSDTNPIGTTESFMLLDFWSQPKSGAVTLFCGPIGISPMRRVYGANAVLKSSPSI